MSTVGLRLSCNNRLLIVEDNNDHSNDHSNDNSNYNSNDNQGGESILQAWKRLSELRTCSDNNNDNNNNTTITIKHYLKVSDRS
mmetsp:Transcript_19834/g.22357  ORF Transcript_19834/g.22357 Transcript_19834/m.22357 type:complete len:84 (+) Transcript_19834:189-440(+)